MNDWGLVKVAGIVEDGTKLKANEKIKTKTEINQKHVTFPRWARGIRMGGGCDNVHQLMLIRRQSALKKAVKIGYNTMGNVVIESNS